MVQWALIDEIANAIDDVSRIKNANRNLRKTILT